MTRALRLAACTPVIGTVLGVASALGHAAAGAAPCAAAGYPNTAALVVEHGDGRTVRLCIGFDSATLSAEQALQASGLEFAEAGYGANGRAVCQIDSEPASYQSCLGSSYWALFVARAGGGWRYASQGAPGVMLAPGDAAGFRYESSGGPDLPPPSAAGTCSRTGQPASAAGTASPNTAAARGAVSAGPVSQAAAPAATRGPASSPAVIGARPLARAAPPRAALSAGLIAAVAAAGALAGLLAARLLATRGARSQRR